MPSIIVLESTLSEPCTSRLPPVHMELEPPTSNTPVLTPGARPAISGNCGRSGPTRSASRDQLATLTGLDVDDRALASHRDRFGDRPTFMSTLIGAVKLASSTMPSRTTVLNPFSVNVTL